MDFTELPFSVLLLQLLEFLPLGSAPCIAAAAHFPDVPAKSFCEYVSTIKRACLQKLRPLLELGFNAPCLSFRHQPALLWDPWLRPSECPWHPIGRDRDFAQRDGDVEASVCPRAGSCCWRLPTLSGPGRFCALHTVAPCCGCATAMSGCPLFVCVCSACFSDFIPFPCPAQHRRMTTHWLGCLCGIMTWEAPRSTMKLSSGSTDLWSRRCGTLTLRILTSQPLSGQHVHGSLPQVNLGHSCYCTYNTSTLACCWCVGRLRTQRVGLASGEQPGVTVRLSSVALLGCRIASPTCTVLRACEYSLVWPGRTQCRLVAVATMRVLCYDNGPVLIRSVTRAIGQGLPRCGDKQLRQKNSTSLVCIRGVLVASCMHSMYSHPIDSASGLCRSRLSFADMIYSAITWKHWWFVASWAQ